MKLAKRLLIGLVLLLVAVGVAGVLFLDSLAKQAVEIARRHGGFTIFAVVDALTRLSAKIAHAGDRAETDEKTGRLLALASNGGGTKTSSRQLAAAVA